MSTIDPAQFREAMGRTASGVTVVTSDGAAGRVGVTVSSLCSLSMDPPSVLFCIHRDSRTLPAILATLLTLWAVSDARDGRNPA